jgi:hypothetical protein
MLKITAATVAVTAAVAAIDRFAKQAEKVSGLGAAFDTLGQRINATNKFLPRLQEATRGAVNDMELMRLANNAIILGVAKSEKQFAELADGAVRLGRAVGLQATPAIESLVTGIGRQSRQMLDNLGIVIRAEDAYKKFAAAVGVSVDELSDEQRKLAFTTEAMKQMKSALAGLNDETVRFSDLWNKAKTTVVNRINEIIGALNDLPGDVREAIRFLREGDVISTGADFSRDRAIREALGGLSGQSSVADIEDLEKQFGIDLSTRKAQAQELERAARFDETVMKNARKIEKQLGDERTARYKKWLEQLQLMVDTRKRLTLEAQQAAHADVQALQEILETGPGRKEFAAQRLDEILAEREPAVGLVPSGSRDAVSEFAGFMKEEFAFAAASFGGGLTAAFTGAKVDIKQMIQSLLAGLAQAIVQAKIFAAIMAASSAAGGGPFAGLFSTGGLGSPLGFARGGVVGAQGGVLLRGGLPHRDSIPIMAQAGEMVLPRAVSDLLVGAARNSQRAGTHSPDPLSASRAAPAINVSLNVSGVTDSEMQRRIADAPEAIAEAIRRAVRTGIR